MSNLIDMLREEQNKGISLFKSSENVNENVNEDENRDGNHSLSKQEQLLSTLRKKIEGATHAVPSEEILSVDKDVDESSLIGSYVKRKRSDGGESSPGHLKKRRLDESHVVIDNSEVYVDYKENRENIESVVEETEMVVLSESDIHEDKSDIDDLKQMEVDLVNSEVIETKITEVVSNQIDVPTDKIDSSDKVPSKMDVMVNTVSDQNPVQVQNDSETIIEEHKNEELSQNDVSGITTSHIETFNVEGVPVLFGSSTSEFKERNNFLKSVNWSPDGLCFMTNSNDDEIRTYSFYEGSDNSDMIPFRKFKEGEVIYDCKWYPFMNCSYPSTALFACSSKDKPIHLWDIYTGKLRATYAAYDEMDEITSAFSLCFNLQADKLYCGFNKMIRVFDISRPGRDFINYSTVPIKGRRSSRQIPENLKLNGIISCMDFNPDYSGLLACGSYSKSICLYAEKEAEPLLVLNGHIGGVTQVKFSRDGYYLYSGSRKENKIFCWDIRNTTQILYELDRKVETNQKMFFDIDSSGTILSTGSQDGFIHFYSLQTGDLIKSFQASKDSVNNVQFHPTRPYLISSTGQRKFYLDDEDDKIVSENAVKIWKN
eukprot:TRINITY_DN9335_c0_g1_i1.p1 TRINITY_DN9335_c0_g1~~TRINITY_DN9335_c0_g1_i1.p1  ORF type:complete len:618 (-),score=146.37 TRINITY_DN9335_c0_g1_i1:18-1814(-)